MKQQQAVVIWKEDLVSMGTPDEARRRVLEVLKTHGLPVELRDGEILPTEEGRLLVEPEDYGTIYRWLPGPDLDNHAGNLPQNAEGAGGIAWG